MNKNLTLLLLAAAFSVTVKAQTPLTTSNCDVSLPVQGDNGTNGVAVAYNPTNQLYYTVFAGNTTYPLEIHDSKGNSIHTQEVGFDVRGMWYNPAKKQLEGICYDNEGSYEITLDAQGRISGSRAVNFSYGMGSQSVATFAEKKKSVLFVEGNIAYFFKPGKVKSKQLELSTGGIEGELNTNGPIYTGVKNYEIGLLNAATMTVHLFSATSGKETGKVELNTEACNALEEFPANFRVSYCNERVFIFDTDSRTWTGYKLF